MNRYVKKPIAIEAVKWKGFNNDDIKDFAGDSVKIEVIREGDADNGIPPSVDCSIETLEGVMKANVGDYIIKGVNGEFYPCKPDIFEKTYDKADDSSVMCFGDAIEVLKQGGAVRRSGWNGKGLMVFKQVPAHILDSYHENFSHRHKIHIPNKDQLLYNYRLIHNHHPNLHNFHLKPESVIQICK